MDGHSLTKLRWTRCVGRCLAALVVGIWMASSALAESLERTTLTIVVKDAESSEPIFNAKLTLQFREPGSKLKLKRSKTLSFNAKTNPQGRYKFTHIPKGTIRLLVTADRHQTFGQEFELEQDDQVIEVKLRKPQPLL